MTGRVALIGYAPPKMGGETGRVVCHAGYRVGTVDSCAADGSGRPAGMEYPLASRTELFETIASFCCSRSGGVVAGSVVVADGGFSR